MPVSRKTRTNGKFKNKVKSRNVSVRQLGDRINGVQKILQLMNRATQGRIDASENKAFITATKLGL